MELGAAELKCYDVAPHLVSMLEKLQGITPHKASLFLILSELLVNAIDHGLLQLDSSLKEQQDGFVQYLALRNERIAALRKGSISVSIEQTTENGQRLMKIAVRDSGNGFDHGQLEEQLNHNDTPHGRGLALVKQLSSRIEFHRRGSEVAVYYPY